MTNPIISIPSPITDSADRRGRSTWLAAAISACALVATARAGLITESATAPNSNILASQLTILGPGGGDGGRNYTDNGGPPGQTFTLSTAAQIQSFTLMGRGDSSAQWNGGKNPWDGSQIWGVMIGAVNGNGSITPLANETATGFTAGGKIDVNDYLTFSLATPINVSAGHYAFAVTLYSSSGPGTDGGWFGLAHSDTDVYAGGTAFNDNLSIANPGGNGGAPQRDFPASGFAAPVPDNYDYVFAVQGSAVLPEPSTFTYSIAVCLVALARRRRRASSSFVPSPCDS